ncbi:MAG: hypothetical protein H0W81_11775 [Chloroflexi bacterium]|nr:hypothetical protein [Chloroflexota bacterium]
MSKLKAIGTTWLAVAALSIAVTVVFRVDSAQIVVTLALALVTAALGGWMVLRPSTAAVGASLGVGIVWLAVYAGLAVLQSDEIAAWVTDAFLAVVGGVVGFVAWTRTSTAARPEADQNPGTLR